MAALDTKENVAGAWLDGTKPRRKLDNMYAHGATLFSYGSHWPLAHMERTRVLVNVGRYQVGNWPVSGAPKFSRVTDDQTRALAWALRRRGYVETAEVYTEHGRTFRVWQAPDVTAS